MNGKFDVTRGNMVAGLRGETRHREVMVFHNTVNDVTQEVVAVDAEDLDPDRIKPVLHRSKVIDGDDGIPLLGSDTDGVGTVAAVDSNRAASIPEADDFAPGHGLTFIAQEVFIFRSLFQISEDMPPCLEGNRRVQPVRSRMDLIIRTDFHAVSAFEDGFDGSQTSVACLHPAAVRYAHTPGD